jgi:hypothetical protein
VVRRLARYLRRAGLVRQAELAERRSCGACSLCCTVRGVDALDKPPGLPCPSLAPLGGCAIYATRPGECRAYLCGWRCGFLEERPDRAGFVVDFHVEEEVGAWTGWSVRPGSDAEPSAVADAVLEVAAATPGLPVSVVPFALPGGELVKAYRPGTPEFRKWVEEIRAGLVPLR